MASVGAEVTSHHWGFAPGFDAYFDDMGSSRDEEQNRWRVERPATEVIDDALGWFAEREDRTKPFFAWLHMFDIHHPYEPPEPYKSQFKDRPYLGEIAWTDARSKASSTFQAMGAMDNTWVFILSDHGEEEALHGESLHGALLYNSTTRIPFIVVPPKRDGGGQRVDFPASIVDVFPTVLSLAGLPIPEGSTASTSPMVEAGGRLSTTTPRGTECLRRESVRLPALRLGPSEGLGDRRHKLIDSTTPELYDAWDMPEREDLASTQATQLSAHRAALSTATEAMVTDPGAAGRAELDQERLEQLAALGYITTTVEEGTPTEGLPDPVTQLPMLKEVEKARSLLQGGDLVAAHAGGQHPRDVPDLRRHAVAQGPAALSRGQAAREPTRPPLAWTRTTHRPITRP